MMASDYKSRI